ncbi:Uncharacterized protein OBRU01_17213 [Operophtera brumata]|uniref:Uncharacterized protein n=1 Tax=Operophtera brumata TaxID=104452 RepID=A0A0L7L1P5_OPEBR|nr:Uncharacterized protein OBRU01_17213 [Operophtera brumata]
MIKQEIILMIYNKDVVCVLEKDKTPICKSVVRSTRRNAVISNNILPSHDPYIPRANSLLYNCSDLECKVTELRSVSQVAFPSSQFKSCFQQADDYECETIKYNNLKKEDKILFLANHIPMKSFYEVDCLVYSDGGRVCHKKDGVESHTNLVDTGTMARPRELSILSQDEFICEESNDKEVNCDPNLFVPFEDGLRLKEAAKTTGDILLKTGSYLVVLKRNCIESWCGFSGRIMPSRRANSRYDVPGGKVYKCYYANKQQICKELYDKSGRLVNNDRDWLNTG